MEWSDRYYQLEAELQKSQGDKATELQRKLAKLKADYDLKRMEIIRDMMYISPSVSPKIWA